MFGHLVDGFQTLDLIEKEPVDAQHKPLNDLIVSEITITANPIADDDYDNEREAERLEKLVGEE